MREREKESSNVGGGARGEEEVGSPLSIARDTMLTPIPGPWDHDLSQRQTFN